jgi:hypothetical protein
MLPDTTAAEAGGGGAVRLMKRLGFLHFNLTMLVVLCLLASGCVGGPFVPVAFWPHELKGWGDTYEFTDLDGSTADRGLLVAIREDTPIYADPFVAEIYMTRIRAGRASLPHRAMWKVIWSNGFAGGRSPVNHTYMFVLADDVQCKWSGPGEIHHGEKALADLGPKKHTCRFVRDYRDEETMAQLCRLVETPPRTMNAIERQGNALTVIRRYIDELRQKWGLECPESGTADYNSRPR